MSQSLFPGAAFDQHSLDALRLTAQRAPQQALRATAQQIEGLFVQMMLKSMRDAGFQGGAFDSQPSRLFTSLYDQQIAQQIAAQGRLGFADLLVRQMQGSPPPPAHRPPSGAPQQTSGAALTSALQQTSGAGSAGAPQTTGGAGLAAPSAREAALSEGFLARLLAPARAAAQRSGIPHQLLIAQAALESGWGQREIRTRSGQPSHNLFGIKATPDWQGETTEIVTTEYRHGVAQRVRAAFRVYQNDLAALTDYVHVMRRNPRYQQVINSASLETAAHALQRGGYASDPDYASKLIALIGQVEQQIAKGVPAAKSDAHARVARGGF